MSKRADLEAGQGTDYTAPTPGRAEQRRTKEKRPRLYRRLQPLAGIVLLALCLPPVLDMPLLGWPVLPLAVLYLAALYWQPRLWLVALPVATVALDLSTWTGRFLYNEFDVLFLATIASGLLWRRYRLSRISRGVGLWLILAYLALLLLGLESWGVFLAPPEAAWSNPYYLPGYYGYKLVRGALWGALLAPLWLALYRDDAARAVNWLLAGCCAAALVLGLIVLWERGTLGVLLAGSAWYHVVNSLLDLSASYRVTGIFSDMHTGGEVLDGVIVLLLPATLHGLLHWRAPLARVVAALALLSLAWCTLVGFTRTTYAAAGLGVLLYLAWQVLRQRARTHLAPAHLVWALGALVMAMAAAALAFTLAGSYGLVGFAALQLLAFLVWRRDLFASWRSAVPAAVGLLALLGLGVMSHFSSSWAKPSVIGALQLVTALVLSFFCTWRACRALQQMGDFNRLIALGGVIALPAVVAFALGGSQINSRMEAVGGDMQKRLAHWQRVIDSKPPGLAVALFGSGAGSFPAAYLATYPATVSDVGSFAIAAEAGHYLRLGAGRDLAFGQRVAVEPGTSYRVRLEVRAREPVRLAVFLCERNVIFASNFHATCQSRATRIQPTAGEFVPVTIALDSRRVGKGPIWQRWPTVLYMKNFSPGTVADIRSVTFDGDGAPVLRNSDFSAGMDHWFFYNDFAHLPWHIKNTPLQVWYDSGWLGVILVAAMVLAGLRRALMAPGHVEALPTFMTAVLVLLLSGLFGTPLDSTRVAWLFYFFLFSVLLMPGRRRVRA